MLKKFFNPKIIIFTILIIFLLLLIPKIAGLLMLLFASYVFAAALNPFVNKLESKIKNRAASATIVVLMSIVVIFALFLPIIIMCWKEMAVLINIMPQKVTNLYNFAISTKLYGHNLADLMPMENLASAGSDIAQNVFSQSVNLTMAAAQMVFVTLALMMFIYYILVDKQYLRDKFIAFFPPDLKAKAGDILYNITSKVGNYVRAQVLSMITVGVMVAFSVAISYTAWFNCRNLRDYTGFRTNYCNRCNLCYRIPSGMGQNRTCNYTLPCCSADFKLYDKTVLIR